MTKSFTAAELDALEDEFSHRVWGPESEEPDARVTVLYDEADRGVARWLVRSGTGWAWASPYGDPAISDPWDMILRYLGRSGHLLRIPDRTELVAGGWVIEDPKSEQLPYKDEADEQIHSGFYHLNRPTVDGLMAHRAVAHFMASIAISLHELVDLHKKYDLDNLVVDVDPGPDQAQEVRAAAGDPEQEVREPEGPVPGEDFPFAN